jgi:hypothetical protein
LTKTGVFEAIINEQNEPIYGAGCEKKDCAKFISMGSIWQDSEIQVSLQA